MWKSSNSLARLAFAGLLLVLMVAAACSAATDLSWEFDKPGDFQGWTATANVDNFRVADGCLSGDVTSIDPYLVGPRGEDFSASEYRYVIIRMRQTRGFMGHFYWGSKDQPFHSGDRQLYFGTKPDGFFHTYILDMSKQPAWKGLINSPRLDPHEDEISGRFDVDYIRITRTAPALLEVTGPTVMNRFARVGDTFYVTATVTNKGGSDAINLRATLSGRGLKYLFSQQQHLEKLPPGQQTVLTWRVRAEEQSVSELRLKVESDSPGSVIDKSTLLPVISQRRPLSPNAPKIAVARSDAHGHVLLENSRVRMVFYRSGSDYAVGELFCRDGDNWKLMGATAPLSRVVYRRDDGGYQEMALLPNTVTMTTDNGKATVTFPYRTSDPQGGVWSGSITYSLASGDCAIRAAYEVECSSARDLACWTGPSLYAGNGSFGKAKDEAVFPGLEWLDGHDKMPGGTVSSNTLDMDSMFADRLAPHPYKVTVPLMAVSKDGDTAAIEWDPLQKWDGENACPSAAFASPNRYDGQANHMMELFLPSIPEWVGENATVAANPYKLPARKTLRLVGYYYASKGDLDRIYPDYCARFFGKDKDIPNAPALPGPATALDDTIADARDGYLDSLWDPAGPGWRIRYKPDITYPEVAATQDIFCESLYVSDPALKKRLRDRVDEAAKAAIARFGMPGLVKATASEMGEAGLPYLVGHLEECLDVMEAGAFAALAKQRPDGSWTVPFDPKYPDLTTPPDMIFLGECAKNAYLLLREARRTGNASLREGGIKALAYMRRFRVAAGIPGSELPQHSPCLRAAQYGLSSYLEGYLLTGEKSYLAQAVKWARAGLQFIYVWGAADRDMMRYADACYYGASYFKGTRWMGKSVPWISQIYAYHLERLSHYDHSMPWRTIAAGIAHHSYQSMLASPYPHAYPDCVRLVEDHTVIGLYFIPEQPYKLASALLGREYAGVGMAAASGGGVTAHISSCGKVESAHFSDSKTLEIRIGYPKEETANLLIYGVPKPSAVYGGSTRIAEAADVDSVPEGWKYDSAHGCLIIKENQGSSSQIVRVVLR